MRTHVFLQKGTWLKCGLHAHTTNSDGELAPTDLVRHYEQAGFDALVITDHWVRTVEPSTEGLLVVPGAELDALRRDGKTYAHVLALGIESDPDPPAADFPGLEETVAWVRGTAVFPSLLTPTGAACGPTSSRRSKGSPASRSSTWAASSRSGVATRACTGTRRSRASAQLLAVATDDSHHPGKDSAQAWVWARCEERTREAVLSALDSGAFYSSSGPEIEALETEGGEVVVRCSPARSITLLTGRTKGARVNAGEGATSTPARFSGLERGWPDHRGALTRPTWNAIRAARGRGRGGPARLDESL